MRHDLTRPLITPRLRIEPLTPQLGAIARQGPEALASAIDADVPPEWSSAGGLRVMARAWRVEGSPTAAERALIVHRGDERVIGDLKFTPTPGQRDTLELGYAVTNLYRRQGYASEAAARLLEWAFAEGGVAQVIAGCDRGNRASVRTLRKLGFWLDGARGADFWWTLTPEIVAKRA